MTPGRTLTRLAVAGALCGPPLTAAALVPARGELGNANAALVLVVVVVAVAALGRRLPALLAALSATVWFDFFHTHPYYSFIIRSREDAVTAALLLAVGLAVAELALRSRRHQARAVESGDEILRLHALTDLVAAGEQPDVVGIAVASELRRLLGLRDVRFEQAPFEAGDRRLPQRPPVLVTVGALQGPQLSPEGLTVARRAGGGSTR